MMYICKKCGQPFGDGKFCSDPQCGSTDFELVQSSASSHIRESKQQRLPPLPKEIFYRVLLCLGLDGKEILNFRCVCKGFKKIAQAFASYHIPIRSPQQFITAYSDEFSNFQKTPRAKTVSRYSSMHHSYNLYINVVVKIRQGSRNGPAYIELFPEKPI